MNMSDRSNMIFSPALPDINTRYIKFECNSMGARRLTFGIFYLYHKDAVSEREREVAGVLLGSNDQYIRKVRKF